MLRPLRAQYFGYTLNQNGSLVEFSEAEKDYSTDIFTTKAKTLHPPEREGAELVLLTLGYAAPHGGGGGEPGRSCNRAAVSGSASSRHAEGRAQGQPADIVQRGRRQRQALAGGRASAAHPGQISDILRKRRCAWESLLAVDESVGEILEELSAKLRNDTYVFFLSDNGLLRGEHRSLRRALPLRGVLARPVHRPRPAPSRGEQSSDVVVNADLTADVLEISGAGPGLTQDGQSAAEQPREPRVRAWSRHPLRGLRRR